MVKVIYNFSLNLGCFRFFHFNTSIHSYIRYHFSLLSEINFIHLSTNRMQLILINALPWIRSQVKKQTRLCVVIYFSELGKRFRASSNVGRYYFINIYQFSFRPPTCFHSIMDQNSLEVKFSGLLTQESEGNDNYPGATSS